MNLKFLAPIFGIGLILSGCTAVDKPIEDFDLGIFSEETILSQDNPLVSPLSISMALGMVANGANGETLTEFETVLKSDLDSFNKTTKEQLKTLGEQSKIANSMWVDQDFVPQTDYTNVMTDTYKAQIYNQELTQAKDSINNWVKGETKGLIPEILTEDLTPADKMVLINTLYFKAKWATPFVESNTEDKTFTTNKGSQVTTAFMQDYEYPTTYIKKDGIEGAVLNYEGGNYRFIALRPSDKSDPRDSVLKLNKEKFESLVASGTEQTMELAIPKFTHEMNLSLKKSLGNMGLTSVFDAATADLSKISDGVFLSDVLHKTKIIVNENGTEAAAVTAPMIKNMALIPTEPLILDSPFAYYIVDNNNNILFAGIYDAP